MQMNILLTSVGRRVKLVEYFKKELREHGDGKIIAVDCDPRAPALYFADGYELVPRIDHPHYITYLKEICRHHQIKAVLSLIDPELSLLARVKDEFAEEGVTVIVSDPHVTDLSLDKLKTTDFLITHQLPHIPTYIDLEHMVHDLNLKKRFLPLIAKPRTGSASLGITKIETLHQLQSIFEHDANYVVQPFIEGEEVGVDAYIDLITNHPVGIFMKKKLQMRAGETDKSVSFIDPELIDLVERLIDHLRPIGPIDIDCFKTSSGYVISEINPRFGGGYPHAYECGVNFIQFLIYNLNGLCNSKPLERYNEGLVMMKYDNVMIL